eukprot:TRINITY_DN15200_c0_g1_i1.p1 TRINITY_DN15200_c0_g1~~TRINITY_DN15200_c0_g1_i1.p1  ORF type:complete len:116 (+),score=22.13 TRINITY_DN15200_c0_g1_i1:138-485(+)
MDVHIWLGDMSLYIREWTAAVKLPKLDPIVLTESCLIAMAGWCPMTSAQILRMYCWKWAETYTAQPALHFMDWIAPVSYTHLRAHETPEHLVCRLLLEKKKKKNNKKLLRQHEDS